MSICPKDRFSVVKGVVKMNKKIVPGNGEESKNGKI